MRCVKRAFRSLFWENLQKIPAVQGIVVQFVDADDVNFSQAPTLEVFHDSSIDGLCEAIERGFGT